MFFHFAEVQIILTVLVSTEDITACKSKAKHHLISFVYFLINLFLSIRNKLATSR